jgi:hypothetical protein
MESIAEWRKLIGLNSLRRNVREFIVGVTVPVFGLGPIIRRGRVIVEKIRPNFSGSRAVSADDQTR